MTCLRATTLITPMRMVAVIGRRKKADAAANSAAIRSALPVSRMVGAMTAIRMAGGKASSARDAMRACRRRLESNVSVMIFPEGTRSRSEEMLPFKDGAFRLAIEAGVPILPLAIHGTRQAIAKHDWRIGPARAIVEVLDPESTEGLTLADVPALKARVRERIARARDALKG